MLKSAKPEVVICAVPYVVTVDPIMAPAVLKANLKQANIESVAIDINIEIVNMISGHAQKEKILDFFFSQIIHPEVIDDIVKIIDYCSDRIISYRAPIIALSLLTYSCQIFTRWLCLAIRQKYHCKIIIGGSGIKNFVASEELEFCKQCKKLGLIDDFISGDGEISFVKYCKGELDFPGINSWQWTKIPDLNCLPVPDYTDYDFDAYKTKMIPICDSKGCVRNCEFCDIIEYWTKFQFRSAENIFSEMLSQIKTYGIKHFSFRNSLTNGNLKEFKRLLDLICQYNYNQLPSEQISWHGFFIVRQASQHSEDMWQKLKASNASLFLGIESVIPRVRHGMGKSFENEDIDYHLEMGRKYQVPLELLMIIGYPTETLEDYETTKQWFKNKKEFANNSVCFVNLSLASILPGTQLARKSDELNLKRGKLPSIWINQSLNITNEQRKQYLLDLQKIVTVDCGFSSRTNEETLEHTQDE